MKGKGAGGAPPPLQRETGDDLFRRCAPPSPKGEGWGDGDLIRLAIGQPPSPKGKFLGWLSVGEGAWYNGIKGMDLKTIM